MATEPRRLIVAAVASRSQYGNAAHYITIECGRGPDSKSSAFRIAADVLDELTAARLKTVVEVNHNVVSTEEAGDNEGPRVLNILCDVAARWNGRLSG